MKINEIILEGQVIHLPTSKASIKDVARIMSSDEYKKAKATMPPHDMYYNFDGFGNVGIKYLNVRSIKPIDEVEELTHIGKSKGKSSPDDPTTEKELIKLGGKYLATMPDGHKIYVEPPKIDWTPNWTPNWYSYYAVSPEGKVDLALGSIEVNNVLSKLNLYAINKQNTLKAHNFYAFLITKLNKTLVAAEQSPGGHAVWKQLQKFHKNISIHGWLHGKAVNVDMRDPEYTHAPEESWLDHDSAEIQNARNMKLIATKKTPGDINEDNLRNTLAAAGLAGAMALGGSSAPTLNSPHRPAATHLKMAQKLSPTNSVIDLTEKILSKYDVNPKLAARIAKAAIKYERSTFPKREDILAIIGIESSFNPSSVSSLAHDPAIGLMQIRPHKWNIKPSSLKTIDGQVRQGAEILHRYYNNLQTVPGTVHAYNVGIGNFKSGKRLNPDYVQKFNIEKKLYSL